jgi:hypothetical protein
MSSLSIEDWFSCMRYDKPDRGGDAEVGGKFVL